MNTKEQITMQLDALHFIDMHIHMDDIPSAPDRSILYFANSIDMTTYTNTVGYSRLYNNIIPCFGIHPAHVHQGEEDLKMFDRRSMNLFMSKSVFIGEIGLDYHWVEDTESYPLQREWLEFQLDNVVKHGSIPTFHTKGAEKEILEIIRERGIKKSLIHWYSGPMELIPKFLELGCYFSIGPDVITGAKLYKHIPIDKMFAETDNPTGVPWVMGVKEPKDDDIKKVYRVLAKKLDISLIDLTKQFRNNLSDLFNLGLKF